MVFDEHETRKCEVCQQPVMYGSRHHQCGTAGSGTPRTDAWEREFPNVPDSYDGMKQKSHYGWKRARQLERELNAARAAAGGRAEGRQVGWWVVFDEPDDLGEVPEGRGLLKNHLVPCCIHEGGACG